jgi:poly-gamma-glutamate synthesis protein (capsule biosynthesis protein)
VVIASIHWGPNWGYAISADETRFSHGLIDEAGIDVVHGHSSHHVKAIEVYRGKLILYGCGDFLNDYEGIAGYGEFRPELSLMYFPELDPATASLRSFHAVPMRVRRFRLERAPCDGVEWLRKTLDREGRALGTHVTAEGQGTLSLHW